MTMIYMDLPRNYNEEHIIVLLNNSNEKWEGKVPTDFVGTLTDLLNDGQTFLLEEDGSFSIELEPEWGAVLLVQ